MTKTRREWPAKRSPDDGTSMTNHEVHGRDSVAHFLVEWKRERDDLDPWTVGITARIHRLSERLLRRSEGWLAPLGLTWEVFSMIVTLRRLGKPYEARPKDILRESLLSSGAVTNRIDRAEKMGLVERRPDPADRRGIVIRLMPAGKRLADKAIAGHFEALQDTLRVLDPQEREQLAALLSKLLLSLEAGASGKDI